MAWRQLHSQHGIHRKIQVLRSSRKSMRLKNPAAGREAPRCAAAGSRVRHCRTGGFKHFLDVYLDGIELPELPGKKQVRLHPPPATGDFPGLRRCCGSPEMPHLPPGFPNSVWQAGNKHRPVDRLVFALKPFRSFMTRAGSRGMRRATVARTPYLGSKVNFCPATLTSNMRPPLVWVNTATPLSKSAFFAAPFFRATADAWAPSS